MSAPEALRLADALEAHTKEVEQSNGRLAFVLLTLQETTRAAAELRRLHEANKTVIHNTTSLLGELFDENEQIKTHVDDLLAALRNLLAEGEFTDYPNTTQWYAVQAARAAIEKAEKVC